MGCRSGDGSNGLQACDFGMKAEKKEGYVPTTLDVFSESPYHFHRSIADHTVYT